MRNIRTGRTLQSFPRATHAEALEPRRLLAVALVGTPVFQVQGTVFRLHGTSYDDSMDVTLSNNDTKLNATHKYLSGPNAGVTTTHSYTVAPGSANFTRIELYGLEGNDKITTYSNIAEQYIEGGEGNDDVRTLAIFQPSTTLRGGAGNDALGGVYGINHVYGEAGNDTLYGEHSGSGSYFGGDGDDVYQFRDLSVIFNMTITELAGGGNDTIDFTHARGPSSPKDGGRIDLSSDAQLGYIVSGSMRGTTGTAAQIENAIGSPLNDTITSNAQHNSMFGGDGDDQLFDSEGNDTLVGGKGNDSYFFPTDIAHQTDFVSEKPDEGTDLISARGNDHEVVIELGSDGIVGNFNRVVRTLNDGEYQNFENAEGGNLADFVDGNSRNNSLTGGPGEDTLHGYDGNDTLRANADRDSLEGGSGNDDLDGGEGNDTYLGGAGNDRYGFTTAAAQQTDTVSENALEGTDTITFSALGSTDPVIVDLRNNVGLAKHARRIVNTRNSGDPANFENVAGGTGLDLIYGNDADNSLSGGSRADTIFGLNGNDTLRGDAGDDLLDGGEGADVLWGLDVDSISVLPGFTDNDTLLGGGGNDRLYGSIGLDLLKGESGNDTLFGQDGIEPDTLDGGDGTDVLGSKDGGDVVISIP